ncbi:MAG: tripartite tricarboxylate transporter substrate binding protein [Burkholderiales bacterium]|jgi:tripartite-type tricarboxylate transporter receptor subunit TctC|nr:tripartite tricarboxylate transporter substrate binding protein [Burkholderiales bacterium]
MNKTFTLAAGTVATAMFLICAAPLTVAAQSYPSRPVRLVVPFPPGGSNDIVGRLVGAGLGERLGRQVVIDNRAGGNSIIGTEIAATSQPDGYTLLVISTSFTTNPIIHKLPYDPKKAFAWVAMLGVGPNVLAVNPGFPAKSVAELIALAKAKPDYVIYASTGVGSNAHFGTELFKHLTGTKMLHVPYKGGGPALIATVAGQAHICLSSLIQAIGHIRSGKLRGLATSGAKRSITLPDMPTIAESGVPGYDTANWWGVAAPRGTAPAIIKRLNAELKVVLENPETTKRMINEGAEPMTKSPEELGKHVIDEMDKWARVAKIAGIKGE